MARVPPPARSRGDGDLQALWGHADIRARTGLCYNGLGRAARERTIDDAREESMSETYKFEWWWDEYVARHGSLLAKDYTHGSVARAAFAAGVEAGRKPLLELIPTTYACERCGRRDGLDAAVTD